MRCSVRWPFAVLLLVGACTAPPALPGDRAPTVFPDGWVGAYAGELRTLVAGQWRVLTAMRLEIGASAASGRWPFAIVYGVGADEQRRDYELVAVDAAAGRYAIDEKNGIVLDAWLADGALMSAFHVGGQTLLTRYRWQPDGIAFELESLAEQDLAATGEGVASFGKMAVQRALLRRLP